MIIALIFSIFLVGTLNLAFYEYRVKKRTKDIDIGQEWALNKMQRKYRK